MSAQLFVLPVNHDNYLTHPKLKYDNFIPVPEVFIPMFDNFTPYQILYGSRFSAKSWTKATQYLLEATKPQYFRAVFARMSQVAARESQFQLFKDLMKRYPLLGEQFEVLETPMLITHKETGNFIKGGSFEKSDKLMSVPDLTRLWIEEPITRGSSLGRTALEDMAGTLRNSFGVQPIVDMTFNPINKSNFIYTDFFETPLHPVFILKANYTHNPFCPQDRIDFLDNMRLSNPSRYVVDGMGEWGTIKTGAEYYGAFTQATQVNKAIIRPRPIHITFDFNVMPYMTAVVNQMYKDKKGRIVFQALKEYTLPPPRSTVRDTCNDILRDWESHIQRYGCYIYGDASGNNRMPVAQSRTMYRNVIKHMRGYVKAGSNLRVSKSNRRHHTTGADSLGRFDLMQQLMSDHEAYIYRIDRKGCPKTIEDYESVLIGPDGGKSKKKVKENGVSFEKYGHTSDAQDYFLCWQLRYQFNL